MQQSVRYGDERIAYVVRFVARRKEKIAIHVLPDTSIRVDAPEGTPPNEVRHAVARRARWVSRRLAEFREARRNVLPREYISGECHFYLGRRYTLKVAKEPGAMATKLAGRYLRVTGADTGKAAVRASLEAWYRNRARDVFARRLETLSMKIDWVKQNPQCRLRLMRTQWGSCSPKGELVLNPHLVKAPSECIDYVILHEFCHLKEHNHSTRFYRLLSSVMPEWVQHKKRLEKFAETILNG